MLWKEMGEKKKKKNGLEGRNEDLGKARRSVGSKRRREEERGTT